jgi:NTE family protein
MSEAPEATGESLPGEMEDAQEIEDLLSEFNASESAPVAKDSSKAPDARNTRARKGLVLCLSGGGYRAALFHLGVLRRLNELGVLSQITRVSSVSGGSIIAAHLARVLSWPLSGTVIPEDEWNEKVAKPFHEFTATDIRTLPILKRLLPGNLFKKGFHTRELEKQYAKWLEQMKLVDLPEHPMFIFCATDMVFGVNWIFTRKRVGDFQVGYVKTPEDWPLSLAVTASSCFPPIFSPVPIDFQAEQLKGGEMQKRITRCNQIIAAKVAAKIEDEEFFEAQRKKQECEEMIKGLRLTDGGNYDNMGLEPVWNQAEYLLVSDGGAIFNSEPSRDWQAQFLRYVGIQGRQSAALRLRRLMTEFKNKVYQGGYISIAKTDKQNLSEPVYTQGLVEKFIVKIRTDLDAFSTAERSVLENHGYLIADATLRRKVPGLIRVNAPLNIPHKDWLGKPGVGKLPDETHIKEALADSSKIRLGRLKY